MFFRFPAPRSLLRSALDGLASVVFAARCRLGDDLLTTASRVPICPGCLGRVRPLELLAFCDRCQRPLSLATHAPGEAARCGPCRQDETGFDRLRSFGAYDNELRQMIVLLKYSGVRSLARPLGDWLAAVVEQTPGLEDVEALVPVPEISRMMVPPNWISARW